MDAYKVTFGITESDLFFRFGLLQQASFLFIYVLIFFKGFWKITILIFLLLLVVISGSRTHLIICLIVGVYYYLANLFVKRKFYLLIQSIIIFFILTLGAKFIIENPAFTKVSYRFNTLLKDPSKAGGARLNYYQNSWILTKKHLFFGNPIYNSKEIAGKYSNDWMPVLTGRTHNVYLAILYAFGILGLIPIVLMLVIYLVYSFKAFYLKNQQLLLFLHLVLIGSIIEGFSAGVYYSYVADALIICLIMFFRYHSVKMSNYSINGKIPNERYYSFKNA
jgi:O-antigen ligase